MTVHTASSLIPSAVRFTKVSLPGRRCVSQSRQHGCAGDFMQNMTRHASLSPGFLRRAWRRRNCLGACSRNRKWTVFTYCYAKAVHVQDRVSPSSQSVHQMPGREFSGVRPPSRGSLLSLQKDDCLVIAARPAQYRPTCFSQSNVLQIRIICITV